MHQETRAHFYLSGAIYEGDQKSGFREGFGKQEWPDGAKYVGEWRLNKASGYGKFVHADGD
jgi:hypothetical protein